MDVNAKGVFFTMQAIVPLIPDGGTIVTISSVAGRGTATASPPYAASKAAVINMTQTTARALAARKIPRQRSLPRVRGHGLPGRPWTWSSGRPGWDSRRASSEKRAMGGNLLGIVGEPEDVAAAVSYLVGPGAGTSTDRPSTLTEGWSSTEDAYASGTGRTPVYIPQTSSMYRSSGSRAGRRSAAPIASTIKGVALR